MLFDLALILAGIGSATVLWHRISRKIPELVAIPDEVIIDRLHEDSARIRVFLLNVRRYWRERKHHQFFLRYAEKALFRAHILMLRTDNSMIAILKKLRMLLGETNGVSPVAPPAETPPPPQSGHPFATPPPRHSRIQEVRSRRAPYPSISAQQRLPE